MIIYLIKCTVAMGISWCIYRLFLADKKTFVFNRIYLLTAIIGSAVAPLISLPTFIGKVNIPYSIYNFSEFNTANIVGSRQDVIVSEAIGLSDAITWILITLSLVLAIRFLYRIITIIRLSQASYPYYKAGIRIAVVEDKRTPFSFFNVIYLDQDSYSKGIDDSIFLHEKYHIQAWHSLDRIIVESLSIFLWMNPFLHLLKRDLVDNHEYAADAYAIGQNIDTQNYLTILLSKSINNSKPSLLLHQFTHSSPLKRIKMITTNQTNGNFWFRPLTLILLLGCLISCSDDIDEMVTENRVTTESKSITLNGPNRALPPPTLLLPINRPLARLLEKWTDQETFGIWIDKIKVQNTALMNKSPYDFSYFNVLEVANNSEDYGNYRYKVHLLTNEGYRVQLEKMNISYEASKKKYPELYNRINEKK